MQHSKILSFEEFTTGQHGQESPEIMGGDMRMGGEPQLELPAPAEKPASSTEPDFDLTMVDEPAAHSEMPTVDTSMDLQSDDSGDDHSHL